MLASTYQKCLDSTPYNTNIGMPHPTKTGKHKNGSNNVKMANKNDFGTVIISTLPFKTLSMACDQFDVHFKQNEN